MGTLRGMTGIKNLGAGMGVPDGTTPEEMARNELIKRYG
jgi:hypothetical protein